MSTSMSKKKKTKLCFDPRSRGSSPRTIGGHAMGLDDLSTLNFTAKKSVVIGWI